MSEKTFRDPVYGYIKLDSEITRSIVDTAVFQRLRNIRQTSYAPLYPSALHNRFAHSLGVYHLGRLAFGALRHSAEEYWQQRKYRFPQTLKEESNWNHYQHIFELACLLHDVGHSPFSHTGEEFYKTSRSSKNLGSVKYSCQQHLYSLTNDEVFISSEGENPAPHEIMSCIVALEAFGDKIPDEDKAFFARCITGLQYPAPTEAEYRNMPSDEQEKTLEKIFRNCCIQLLNSKVIDVDRLDYFTKWRRKAPAFRHGDISRRF